MHITPQERTAFNCRVFKARKGGAQPGRFGPDTVARQRRNYWSPCVFADTLVSTLTTCQMCEVRRPCGVVHLELKNTSPPPSIKIVSFKPSPKYSELHREMVTMSRTCDMRTSHVEDPLHRHHRNHDHHCLFAQASRHTQHPFASSYSTVSQNYYGFCFGQIPKLLRLHKTPTEGMQSAASCCS